MGKQTIINIRKTLAVSIAVIFVMANRYISNRLEEEPCLLIEE